MKSRQYKVTLVYEADNIESTRIVVVDAANIWNALSVFQESYAPLNAKANEIQVKEIV